MVSSKFSHRTHSHPTPHVCHPPPPPPPPIAGGACEYSLLPESQNTIPYDTAEGTVEMTCTDSEEEEQYYLEWEVTGGEIDAPEYIEDAVQDNWTWTAPEETGTYYITCTFHRDLDPIGSLTVEVNVQEGGPV